MRIYRSSHRRCSVWIGVLRNFAKFTGKHLCQSLFFNKVAGLRPATLLKKEALAQVFSCEFCEISKNTFFTEHLRWLLLDLVQFVLRHFTYTDFNKKFFWNIQFNYTKFLGNQIHAEITFRNSINSFVPNVPCLYVLKTSESLKVLCLQGVEIGCIESKWANAMFSHWSYRMCSINKAAFKNFAIFTGKHLCWDLFLIKLKAFKSATLWKRVSDR